MKQAEMLTVIQDELGRQLDQLRQQVQNIREAVKGLPDKNDK